MQKKILAMVIGAALLPSAQAWADCSTDTSGTSSVSMKKNTTLPIAAGTTYYVADGSNTIAVNGVGEVINNAGTIEECGTGSAGAGRAIRDKTDPTSLTLTNSGLIESADDDAIQMQYSDDSVVLKNTGTILAANLGGNDGQGGQAVDFSKIATGTNQVYNYSGATIEAVNDDAVRPGVNGYVYNDGLIKSVYAYGESGGTDGIDGQTNSGITIVNDTTGVISGARHGITGGQTTYTSGATYSMSISNALGGVIEGNDGSGVNIDGFTTDASTAPIADAQELVTIKNYGTIIGNGVTGDGDGVDVDGLVNITNYGTIVSQHAYNDASEGVTVGGGTIVNYGTIEGINSATNADGTVNTGVGRGITLAGVDKDPSGAEDANGNALAIPTQGIYANSSVDNYGVIRGSSDSAIAVTGAANSYTVSITNEAGAIMEGGGSTAAVIDTGSNDATVIDYGTITADSSNLAVKMGTANSSLQILGGSAQINGNLEGGGGSLSIIPGSGDSFSYSGAISDFGSVSIGAGTTILSGASTYSADTTLSGGTLLLANNSAIGTGTLNASGNATLEYANGLTLANAISASDDTRFDVEGSDSAIQSGNVSVSGDLTKAGSGTLILDGTSSATSTTVSAGTLEVGDADHSTASLTSNVTVDSGAVLRGHGSIDGNVVNDGTVEPGGSIGVLTINGNYTQSSNGVLAIETLPNGQTSQLTINGVANIAGSALILTSSGNWAPQTTYSFITATGGIVGSFSSISTSMGFLTPVLSYANGTLSLTLDRNDISFASVAMTPNERAAASAADGLGFGSALYTALTEADTATAQQAFNQISGQIYASTRTALVEDSRYVRDAINDHLLGVANGANGISATDANGISAWTSGWGHWGSVNGNSNAAALKADGSGLLVGADLPLGDVRVGAVVGSSQNSTRLDEGSDAHSTGTHLGFYGAWQLGGFRLLGGAAYAWQRVDSNRSVAFDNYSNNLHSHYDADTAQAYLDGSYAFQFGRNSIAPFINVAHVLLQTDAAHENGGAAALNVNAQSSSSNDATLGLRGVFALDAQGAINVHASLGFQQAWGTLGSQATVAFEGGSTAFDVSGVPLAKHAGVAGVGVSFALAPKFSADVSYNGQFGGGVKDQSAGMNFTWSF